MRCAEPTYHSQFIAKCQIDCVVSVSEPGVTGGNHSATEEQHGSPCRRYGRAPLRLTASRPDRALRSSSFCFVGSPDRDSALRVRSRFAPRNPVRSPQQSTSTHRCALGSVPACSWGAPTETGRRRNEMYLNNVTSTGFANGDAQTPTTREATIVQHLPHVHALAKRLRSQVPPCVTLDDLIGAGTIGLIQALDRFQSSRGLQFATYAKHRIRGAMLDFLREEDPLSRTERRRTRTANATAEGALPTTISLEQLPAQEQREYAPARCFSTRFADRVDLDRARQCLSERENRVISLLFNLDWQNRDVASELGVNESRVSQIKQSALSKLRVRLLDRDSSRAA